MVYNGRGQTLPDIVDLMSVCGNVASGFLFDRADPHSTAGLVPRITTSAINRTSPTPCTHLQSPPRMIEFHTIKSIGCHT